MDEYTLHVEREHSKANHENTNDSIDWNAKNIFCSRVAKCAAYHVTRFNHWSKRSIVNDNCLAEKQWLRWERKED